MQLAVLWISQCTSWSPCEQEDNFREHWRRIRRTWEGEGKCPPPPISVLTVGCMHGAAASNSGSVELCPRTVAMTWCCATPRAALTSCLYRSTYTMQYSDSVLVVVVSSCPAVVT